MLITAAATFDRLITLTSPGAPVAPVLAGLDDAARVLRDELPALRQSRAGAQLVDQLDRIRNSAEQLHGSLQELVSQDSMTTFDPGFAADDAAWDSWFTQSAQLVRDASQLARDASQAPGQPRIG